MLALVLLDLFLLCTRVCVPVQNEYVTGQDLIVDGGNWLMKGPPSPPRDMVEAIAKGVEKQSRAMGPGAEAKKCRL